MIKFDTRKLLGSIIGIAAFAAVVVAVTLILRN